MTGDRRCCCAGRAVRRACRFRSTRPRRSTSSSATSRAALSTSMYVSSGLLPAPTPFSTRLKHASSDRCFGSGPRTPSLHLDSSPRRRRDEGRDVAAGCGMGVPRSAPQVRRRASRAGHHSVRAGYGRRPSPVDQRRSTPADGRQAGHGAAHGDSPSAPASGHGDQLTGRPIFGASTHRSAAPPPARRKRR